MKNIALSAFLGHAVLAQAQWWAGAPDCAHDCFSSYWSSSTAWPAPTSYCSASQGASVSDCLRTACSATPTAVTSYSSLSSSLCSQWSSCSAAGSTGVYTISAPAFTGGNWPGPGNWGGGAGGGNGFGNGHGGPGGGPGGNHPAGDAKDASAWSSWASDRSSAWSQFTRTWSGGAYTVTGCEWNGNPWAGGPGGCGPGGAAGSPWGPWGSGWTWSTVTQTVTKVLTVTSDGGVTALSTSVGLGAVALAVSGDVTSTSLIGAAETTASGGGSGSGASGGGASGGGASATGVPGAAAAVVGRDGALGVKVAGAVLGGVVVVAALL